jgi:hypothetical protein
MAAKESVRHHYISRFLMRPFSYDTDRVFYFDKASNAVKMRDISGLFMGKNLYRDETHFPDDPTKIEDDFSKLEDKAARIIRQFRESDEVMITVEEAEILKVFFALMSLRAERVKDMFSENMKQENKAFYAHYRKDESFVDMWRRNISEIVKCKSPAEVIKNPKIDEPFRLFIHRDSIGIAGTYFTIIQSGESREFILGDAYPTVVDDGFIPMYAIFPISPQRAIMLCYDGVTFAKLEMLGLKKKSFFQHPRKLEDGTMRIHTGVMDDEDVNRVNKRIFDASEEGVLIHEPGRLDFGFDI